MNEKEYLRLRRQIDEEYRANIEALERVRELSRGTSPGRTMNSNPDGLADKVKEAVNAVGDGVVFTKRSLTNQLRKVDPTIPQAVQGAVGGILRRMHGAGEIALVRGGKGKRASEYMKSNGHVAAGE